VAIVKLRRRSRLEPDIVIFGKKTNSLSSSSRCIDRGAMHGSLGCEEKN
jgi:hypothetical protein